ncbi:MAG TPA: response regulator transcription factor [Candidatus Acidoferrum sp.]|jgi:DNA-binding NarL/FixJ family response regulator|nr:response regulator transcription factor [Candidatus Acidoferrum sp.]
MNQPTNQKSSPIRILIADDHYIVRIGLIAMVNLEPDMEVVAEATDGNQATAMFKKWNPDLTLLDVRMPVKNGIEAAAEIRQQNSEARILMLTALDGDEDIHRAMEAGAAGYVLKDSTEDKLLPAIRAVASGKRWIPEEVAKRLESRRLFEDLTPRELLILNEVVKGLANKQIADVLSISENTVKWHLKNILAKLCVSDRAEAVAVAIQRGIIHLSRKD